MFNIWTKDLLGNDNNLKKKKNTNTILNRLKKKNIFITNCQGY